MILKDISVFTAAIIVVFMTSVTARGVEAEVTAGKLHTLFDNPETVSTLSLKGTVNAADLFFIAESMPALKELDLSGVSITAFDNGRSRLGLSSYHMADMIPATVFAGAGLTSVILPQSPGLCIGDMAFAGSALSHLVIDSNVMTVGMGAFSACDGLKELTLSVSDIGGSHIFDDCTALAKVSLEGVKVIPASTFEGCAALSEVTGFENIMSVGARAFEGCSSLADISFDKNLKYIGDEAFARTAIKSLDLSRCTSLSHIGRWAFAHCTELLSVSLPSSLNNTGQAVFFDCKSLDSLTLSSETVIIDDFALKGLTAVSELSLPASLDSIGDYAMASMTGLTEIDASALGDVPSVGNNVWHGVDCPAVRLLVDGKIIDLYSSAEQWMDFDIVDAAMSSADDTSLSSDTKQPAVSGRFDGEILFIIADRDIDNLRVFDTSGRILASAHCPAGTTSASVKVTAVTAIMIVEATLTGGIRAVLKIRK